MHWVGKAQECMSMTREIFEKSQQIVYFIIRQFYLGLLVNCERKSMGTGKMMVEFFSVAMELRVYNVKRIQLCVQR